MNGNLVTSTLGKPAEAPRFRGMAGEQAFYDALTLNLGWFEREMAALRAAFRTISAPVQTGRAARPAH